MFDDSLEFGEYFFDGGGGVDEGKAKLFGDVRVGGVDFLLEGVGLFFEGFGGFATIFLAG